MDRNVNIIVGLNGERIFISSSFPDEYVGSESRLALKGAAAKAKANAAQGMVSGLADMGKIKLDAKAEKCVRGMAGHVGFQSESGLYTGQAEDRRWPIKKEYLQVFPYPCRAFSLA